MIVSGCGRGRSCFACWWRSDSSAGRSSRSQEPAESRPARDPRSDSGVARCRQRPSRASAGGGAHPARPVLPAADPRAGSASPSRYRSLTLPTVANPCHPTGGLWGESKSDYLLDVAASERRWIADFVTVTRSTRAAHALRRPRAGAAILVRRRLGISADRQARRRPSRRMPDRRCRAAARISPAFPGGRKADAAAFRAPCRERPRCSMRGCRARRAVACSR